MNGLGFRVHGLGFTASGLYVDLDGLYLVSSCKAFGLEKYDRRPTAPPPSL